MYESRALNSALECGASIGRQSGEFHRSIGLAQWKHTYKGAMNRGSPYLALEYLQVN